MFDWFYVNNELCGWFVACSRLRDNRLADLLHGVSQSQKLESVFTAFMLASRRRPLGFVRHAFSLLLRGLVFRMKEASAKRVTGDEPQRTMGIQRSEEMRKNVTTHVSSPFWFDKTCFGSKPHFDRRCIVRRVAFTNNTISLSETKPITPGETLIQKQINSG